MKSPCHQKDKTDWFLWTCLSIVLILYVLSLSEFDNFAVWITTIQQSVYELINTMWWGIFLGIIMLGLLTKVPKEMVISLLGKRGKMGVIRATLAGVLLDLCSHGILMIGAKLYERGASIGQVTAFLIASPWNSFSLTIILVTLIGLPWTLAFIGLSMVIGVVAGLLFDKLVQLKVLPSNSNSIDLPKNYRFLPEFKALLSQATFSPKGLSKMLWNGLLEARMVIRWIMFGVLLASSIRTFVPIEYFTTYFGPTLAGLGLTVLVATIIEVCSEGTTPVAADLLTRAKAPGNSFAFLMIGVSTDYTEIMVLKDRTRSWEIALFLPLLTVPQVLFIAWMMNFFH